MDSKSIQLLVEKQKEFFSTGETLSIKHRIQKLKQMKNCIKNHEADIAEALKKDLGKSEFESYMCETGQVLSELSFMIKNIKKFAKEKRVRTPLSQFAAKSYEKPVPLGTVLVMSPWNYPFLLTLDPLVDAIAAGNTAIVKPSAYSPATGEIIKKIIGECFSENYVAVVLGGRNENASLLEQKFDLVFFTGSQNVGKEVLRHAAETLTPVILELGGKSPCIVDSTAKIGLAAKRIVFGKFINCGQTCVAPDYILCQSSVKDKLVKEIIKQTKAQFGQNPLQNLNYGKIINQKHFDRICGLISNQNIVLGGGFDKISQKIEPTVLDSVDWGDKVMQEEIFGPLLPILTFEKLDDVVLLLKDKPEPLALYMFSQSKKNINKITEKCRYGGGCINDTIIHLSTSELGFGGVGESGMGAYHGKTGFDAFSHKKSIVNKRTWMDFPIRYQPYKNKFYKKLLRLFLR